MKTGRKYIIPLGLVFLAFVLVEYYSPQPVNWNPSFSKRDKIPYGSFIPYDYLTDIFPGKKVKESTMPVYNTLDNIDTARSNYIIINDEFSPDTLDAEKLLEYVQAGNNAFIAVENYSGPLADSLKIHTTDFLSFSYNSNDSTSLNFTAPELHSPKNFAYRRGTVDHYFSHYDTAHTEILGNNSLGKPNYIKIVRGKGAFYLSAVPIAFTNYNAVKANNSEYIFRTLSALPVANIMWDEYYKVNKLNADTPLRYILNTKTLRYAYYLLILLVLLYVFFEGKRKQRAIPVLLPLQNTSLEFVETVGLLYYQKGTNEAIAKKKIQYFFDYLRSKFNITAKPDDTEYITLLAHKTGVAQSEVTELIELILEINDDAPVNEDTLIKLNNKIEDFYQKTK